MNETAVPVFPPPTGLLAAPTRHLRAASGSPTRQSPTDELLARLSPSSALHALRNPSGDLKTCFDSCTPSEQSYAMNAAVASKRIQEWVVELSAWPWPSGRDGSAGFDRATGTNEERGRRGLVVVEADVDVAGDATAWMGCLRAEDVARYERRVDQIQTELHDLDIEGLKKHVLHHHIMPLSRPGTPVPDSRRSSSGSSAPVYNRMDDLTAVVTATLIQALPILSRLNRLMNTWNTRLLILRRIPSLLASLEDAEVALKSGWNAINLDKHNGHNISATEGAPVSSAAAAPSSLQRKDFEVMKLVVGQKTARAARDIDFMLDTLGSTEESIPEDWIDRMDNVERDYGEWVAVCERKIREAELVAELARTVRQDEPRALETEAAEADNVPDRPSSSTSSALISPDTTDNVSDRPTSSASDMTTIMHDSQTETPELPRMLLDTSTSLEISPPISPHSPESPSLGRERLSSVSFNDKPSIAELEAPDDETPPKTPNLDSSFLEVEDNRGEDEEDYDEDDADTSREFTRSPSRMSMSSEDDQLQQQISEILESIPAKIHLSSRPAPSALTVNHLNPPDLQLPHLNRKPKERTVSTGSSTSRASMRPPFRSSSSLSTSSRAGTPSFLLAPAYARGTRASARNGAANQARNGGSNKDIKVYHLSRSTGEAPIKLFIRLVGEHGERVMVRVGGGWADLGEYLKEYAIHHGRRSKAGGEAKIEVRDLPMPAATGSAAGTPVSTTGGSFSSRQQVASSPIGRPASALDSPITPLNVRKRRETRRSFGGGGVAVPSSVGTEEYPLPAPRSQPQQQGPNTPLNGAAENNNTPSSDASTRSRSSSRLSWVEEDSSLGMSGPRTKNVEMSVESKAWVQSVKEKVRIASGEQRKPLATAAPTSAPSSQAELFGEMGKVGGTKRLFRKAVP